MGIQSKLIGWKFTCRQDFAYLQVRTKWSHSLAKQVEALLKHTNKREEKKQMLQKCISYSC